MSHNGLGWFAYVIVRDEDAKDTEGVAIYCPKCAARKFDPE